MLVRSEQLSNLHRQVSVRAASALAYDELAVLISNGRHSFVILPDLEQENRVRFLHGLISVQISVNRPAENPAFGYQNRVGLMQSGSSECQTPGQGSAVFHMSPGIEPGVFFVLPDVPDEQALGGIA